MRKNTGAGSEIKAVRQRSSVYIEAVLGQQAPSSRLAITFQNN